MCVCVRIVCIIRIDITLYFFYSNGGGREKKCVTAFLLV